MIIKINYEIALSIHFITVVIKSIFVMDLI